MRLARAQVRMPRAEAEAPLAGQAEAPLRASLPGLMASGRLSMLDIVEVELSGNSASSSRCARAQWVAVAICCSVMCGALWAALRSLYFQEGVLVDGREVACDSAVASHSRAAMHWFVGTAPAWARNFVVLALIFGGCRRVVGLPRTGPGIAQAVLAGGVGEDDGEAEDAGWLCIVGGRSDGQPQCTWAQARDARGLQEKTARWLGGMKLVFWHWSQPTAYLWLLYAYRCFVAQLGAVQQNLAAVVAAREVIYLVSTVVALWFCPVFLLLDLGTVWNEANSPLEAVMRIAMYMLTPHTYIALSLANHFRRWAQVFVCIAAVQVLADISSCYALASLMARNIEVGSAVTNSSAMSDQCMLLPGEPPELERACFTLDTAAHCEALSDHCVWASDLIVDIAPLAIGYGLTAFGFLFFFGPLSISSSFQGCLDKERHRILRLAKAVAGALLLVVWVTIVTVLIWLIGGGNPFCSGIASFILTPCSGHGECYGAAQCHCAASWGPESEVSGTNLCSCPKGFIGDGCNACEAGFIGEHCTTAFMISGANNTNMPTGTDDINGEYVKTEHVCSGKPVYQKGSADGWVLFSCSDDHGGKPCWTVGNSRHARSCRWDSGNQIGNYFCLTSPDDSGCTGMWYERDSDDRNPNPTAPGISVAAVAGMGCELHPDPDCGAHGRCVGRTKDEKKYDSRSCTCDSGWSGAQCDHDPCAAKPCGPHALTCSRNRDGLGCAYLESFGFQRSCSMRSCSMLNHCG
eukprot:COSAG01_NODE_5785_length_4034_cov_4.877255_1_plen_748_part_00